MNNNTHPASNCLPTTQRRQFLKTTAVSVSAVAGLSLARSAHAAGSETIRIGMVGCGGRCSGAAMDVMNVDPGTQLVAMADLFEDRVKSQRTALATAKPKQVSVDDDHCFVGLDAYKKVIECVDVVLIACAAKFHPMYLKAGIDAGKHVFVEKPHAIDPAGIKVVNETCRVAKEKNLGVLSGLHSRFAADYRETIERVRDGQIGDIVSIEENFVRGPYGNTARPANWRELEIQYGNQYRFSWLCGDDVTQSLVHNLDRATWALGEATPVDCHGFGGRSGRQDLLGDVFDHHTVVYRYANGVRLYAFCRTTAGCYNEGSSIIMGSKGIAYPLKGQITGETPWSFEGKTGSPYQAEQKAYFESIRAGQPLNSGDYMARSTLVAIMGQMSCYSGQEVKWDKISKSDFAFDPKPEDCSWDMEPPTRPDPNGVYPVCASPGITKNV
ncbi:Gfo/Idh/MocA family protein [Novipirellula artificiosorum]|uniref:Glycosyl hydrolase n=1 Tax=Novipirellula artificiosorum TaxID=2528016 RepID=A0A5C6DTS2_9BACT|nr:Gfo/Idh/MocA family oxidoreductase [Novipirellula artificiosorum]TWU38436.1 Glycosyl hydrolase [Novipirellula artificiosorum]